MELITNSVCPGRWHNSRVPPDAAEMSSTQIMRMRVESGSAKVREGIDSCSCSWQDQLIGRVG